MNEPEPGDLVMFRHSAEQAPAVFLHWEPLLTANVGIWAIFRDGALLSGYTLDKCRTFRVLVRYRDTVPITDF